MLAITLIFVAVSLVSAQSPGLAELTQLVQSDPDCFGKCGSSAALQTSCRANPNQACLCTAQYLAGLKDCETCANALAVGQPQPVKNQAVALQNAYTGVRERCGGQLSTSSGSPAVPAPAGPAPVAGTQVAPSPGTAATASAIVNAPVGTNIVASANVDGTDAPIAAAPATQAGAPLATFIVGTNTVTGASAVIAQMSAFAAASQQSVAAAGMTGAAQVSALAVASSLSAAAIKGSNPTGVLPLPLGASPSPIVVTVKSSTTVVASASSSLVASNPTPSVIKSNGNKLVAGMGLVAGLVMLL